MKTLNQFYLFSFFFLLYIATMGGRSLPLDTKASVKTAQAVIEKGRFDLELTQEDDLQLIGNDETSQFRWHTFFKAGNGKVYSKYGFGFPVFLIPFVLLGKLLYAVLGAATGLSQDFFETISVSLVGSFTMALSCLLLFKFGQRLGCSGKTSFILALLFGWGTMAWHYAGGAFNESIVTLELLCGIYFIFKASQTGENADIFWAAMAVGILLFTRNAAIIFLPLLAGYVIYSDIRQKKKHTVIFLSVIAIFLALIFWVNFSCFGGIFKTAYGGEGGIFLPRPFMKSFLNIAVHYLFSFQKGLFSYNPIAIAGLLALPYFYKKEKLLLFLIAGIFIVFSAAVFLTTYNIYAGGGPFSWGGRYFLILLPYFILPLGYLLEKRKMVINALTVLLFTVSFFINLAGVLVPYEQYGYLKQELLKRAWTRPAYVTTPDGIRQKKTAVIFGTDYIKSFPPDMSAMFTILKKKMAGDEFYTYSDFGINYPSTEKVTIVGSDRDEEFKGLNLWYVYLADKLFGRGKDISPVS